MLVFFLHITHVGLGVTKKIAVTEEKLCGKFDLYFIFLNIMSPIQVSRFQINWSASKISSPQASGRGLTYKATIFLFVGLHYIFRNFKVRRSEKKIKIKIEFKHKM